MKRWFLLICLLFGCFTICLCNQTYVQADDLDKKEPIIIAILDTGFDFADDNVNFSDSPVYSDRYGHGTHMATIAKDACPNCRLLNVKITDDLGMFSNCSLADGIRYAVDNGADIINISLANNIYSVEVYKSVQYAKEHGVIIFAAAGNKARETAYPAKYDYCIAVKTYTSWSGQGEVLMYGWLSTSEATAYASGLRGLYLMREQ